MRAGASALRAPAGDPAAELAALMARFQRDVGPASAAALSQAAVSSTVKVIDAYIDSMRALRARLDARVARNAAREAELAAREAALAGELRALSAAAASSGARRDAAAAHLRAADAAMAASSKAALAQAAVAAYEFEEQNGNLIRANQARERGFSASVALDVTNTQPRAGVSARSLGVAAGGGRAGATGRLPPPSPMRKKDAAIKHAPLRDAFGFV